jgi:predicted nucleotidyltransferase
MILRDKDKDKIIKIAKGVFDIPFEIIAFGSRVTGKAHECSDLDLVIKNKNQERLNIDKLIEFKEKLTNSNIPILVQVMDWYTIPKYFQENILKKNVKLYETYYSK